MSPVHDEQNRTVAAPDKVKWILLIAGGPASGKKTLADNVKLNLERLCKQSSDCQFSVQLTDLDKIIMPENGPNTPSEYDFRRAVNDLEIDSTYSDAQVAIVYGKYALYDQKIRDLADMKVFIDGDDDVRLSRWILRDIKDDSSKLDALLKHYLTDARPEMNKYISPSRQYADVILPGAAKDANDKGVEMLAIGIYDRIRESLLDGDRFRPSVSLLPPSTPEFSSAPNLLEESVDSQINRYYELA